MFTFQPLTKWNSQSHPDDRSDVPQPSMCEFHAHAAASSISRSVTEALHSRNSISIEGKREAANLLWKPINIDRYRSVTNFWKFLQISSSGRRRLVIHSSTSKLQGKINDVDRYRRPIESVTNRYVRNSKSHNSLTL